MSSSTKQTPAAGSKILISGASGFLAIACIDELLKEGFSVVGSVRSAEKGDYVKKFFEGKPFEYIIVEDVGEAGAFDKAVQDVEGVLHTASPFHFKATDPEELVRPAVDGTTNILKSVGAHGKNVRRVVVTSSVASVIEPAQAPHTFTEKDWNNASIREIEKRGKDASPGDMYMASKSLAEKAAWDIAKEHNISLATINPPFILGPVHQDIKSPDGINTSVGLFYSITKGEKSEKDLPGPLGNWVDVRDVAKAHYLALTKPEADGERFIISAGPFCTQDLTEALLKVDPSLPNIPKGESGAAAKANDPSMAVIHSGEKATKVLGLQYTSIQDCVEAMYESLKAKGF